MKTGTYLNQLQYNIFKMTADTCLNSLHCNNGITMTAGRCLKPLYYCMITMTGETYLNSIYYNTIHMKPIHARTQNNILLLK